MKSRKSNENFSSKLRFYGKKNVLVPITNKDGIHVEEGEAIKEANGPECLYIATVQNDSFTGDKITVKASDIPGNVAIWD